MSARDEEIKPHPQCKEDGEHYCHSWQDAFGFHRCPGRQDPSPWCPDCKLRKGVGCACGMTFAEKMKTVQIDKHSLRQPYYPGRRGER